MSNSFGIGDVVVVLEAANLKGAIGIVKGPGNLWDYTVAFPTLHNETFRLSPEQLVAVSLEMLISLASPVSPEHLVFLAKMK